MVTWFAKWPFLSIFCQIILSYIFHWDFIIAYFTFKWPSRIAHTIPIPESKIQTSISALCGPQWPIPITDHCVMNMLLPQKFEWFLCENRGKPYFYSQLWRTNCCHIDVITYWCPWCFLLLDQYWPLDRNWPLDHNFEILVGKRCGSTQQVSEGWLRIKYHS